MFDRRTVLQGLGLGLVALPLGAACSEEVPAGGDPDARSDAGSPDAIAADSGVEVDSGAELDSGEADSGVVMGWATGGTAAITGLNYPDPFAGGLGNMCPIYPANTLGPCYARTLDRQDISEGVEGLPVRMVFAVVNSQCQPVAGASVDIWHTSPGGFYSGDDSIQLCTSGDAGAIAARYFRGIRTSGADGRVTFDTCFPGWYPGRTIHIHFTVRVGNTEYLTSQLYFEDALSDEIIATQPHYSERGAKDTNNRTDGVLRQTPVGDNLVQTQRMNDGVMLAWKAISINV